VNPRHWRTHKSEEGMAVEFDAEVTKPQEQEMLAKLSAAHDRCETRVLRD
jgi:hypothetical protein